jgi:replicative DNA helicase
LSRTIDTHAEYGVLASLINDPSCYDRIGTIVSAADFSATTNRTIFEVVSSMILAHKGVDPITVHSEVLARGYSNVELPTLLEIAHSEVTSRGAKRYAEAVRIASLERQLRGAIAQADEIADGDGELGERMEAVTSLFSGLAHKPNRKMPRHVSEIAIGRIDHYTDLSQGNVPPAWRTGISSLDLKLNGGVRPGKVYVLAARPKIGKTSLAAQIAMTIADREELPTLILTQEMPDEEVVDRGIANLGRVGYSGLLTGKLSNEDWGGISEGCERLTRLPLWIDDQGGLTLADIRSKARFVKGLKLLVIDYLQLCSGSAQRGAPNRNAEIEEISRGVKALSKELDCAVILLSQLNRDVEKRADKRPNLSDLRDSGAIEQDADAIVFLWFARMLSSGHKLIGCDIAANRSGATGDFGLDFDGSRQRWVESDQDPRFTPATPARTPRRGFHEVDDE